MMSINYFNLPTIKSRVPFKDTSYTLELNIKQGNLYYFGTTHTNNPENPQFETIERKWNEFQPTIALSEGGIWALEKSRELAIIKHGEQGLIRYLAARDKIPIKSIEPVMTQEALYLLRKFSPEQIKIYYILRQAIVNQILNRDLKQEYEER